MPKAPRGVISLHAQVSNETAADGIRRRNLLAGGGLDALGTAAKKSRWNQAYGGQRYNWPGGGGRTV